MNPFVLAQAHDEHGHDHGAEGAVGGGDEAMPAATHEAAGATAHQATEAHEGQSSIIATHWQVQTGMGTLNMDTVMYGGTVMILLLVVFGFLGRTVQALPGQSNPVGNVLEGIVEFCSTMIHDFIGHNVRPYLWYIGSLFVFILAANWIALLPWKAWEMSFGTPLGHALGMPHALVYEAPTADLNLTLGLGLISLVLYWYFGIAANGITGFLGHHWFDKPAALFPLRMLEDITRPVSLAIRLFANMTAGHIVALVLLTLTYVMPVVLLPLELFVGAVQAFVFAVLSASYIGAAAADHSHSH